MTRDSVPYIYISTAVTAEKIPAEIFLPEARRHRLRHTTGSARFRPLRT